MSSYDVLPGHDRWGVSRSGTEKATISDWSGNLQWRTVYDEYGGTHRVAVLTDVSGLNPRDRVDRSGRVIEHATTPPVFYLTDSNHRMLTTVNARADRVRVHGELHAGASGGVVYANDDPDHVHPLQAHVADPTTVPTSMPFEDRFRLLQYKYRNAITPIIYVHEITAIPSQQ